MLNGHGSDLHNYTNIKVDFSSNVWYKGTPPELNNYLKEKLNNLSNYPSPDAFELSIVLAQHHNLLPNNVLVTNGATEAFYLLAQSFARIHSIIFQPSFSEYADACQIFEHRIDFIPNAELSHEYKFKANSLIWIGNPNNPDGKVISVNQIENFCLLNPNCTFIIDEAYISLFYGVHSAVVLIKKHPNLIIVHSLTKTFSIPALRLGYVIAPETIIKKLKKLKMPWSVNTLAIEAGMYLMKNYQKHSPDIQELKDESSAFMKELSLLNGVKVFPTQGNYFLLKLKNGNASNLKEYLAKEFKVLIRDASNFKGLNKQYFRVALRSTEDNKLLIKSLKKWLTQ